MQLQRAFKVIKSIQRGVVALGSGGSTASVFISPVDLSKAVLLVGGVTQSYKSGSEVFAGIGGQFVGAGELVFEKNFVSSPSFKAEWQVVEYV